MLSDGSKLLRVCATDGPSECFLPSYLLCGKSSTPLCSSLACFLLCKWEIVSCRGLCAVCSSSLRDFFAYSSSIIIDMDKQRHLRGVAFHDEKGPSLTPPQLPMVLVRLPRVGCLVTLPRTSLRPSTLPNPNTSGRSRSNGSDCRTVRPVGNPGVSNLVAGRLGPGSPKYE